MTDEDDVTINAFDSWGARRLGTASFAAALWIACMFTQPAAAGAAEKIGTVTEVYDGTLTSDIQVRTFRNIDRLFPVGTVKHGPNVLALPPAPKPLAKVAFKSGGKPYDLIDY